MESRNNQALPNTDGAVDDGSVWKIIDGHLRKVSGPPRPVRYMNWLDRAARNRVLSTLPSDQLALLQSQRFKPTDYEQKGAYIGTKIAFT